MNNNAVLLYDGPLSGGGAGYGLDGLRGKDFDVGNGVCNSSMRMRLVKCWFKELGGGENGKKFEDDIGEE